MQKSRKR